MDASKELFAGQVAKDLGIGVQTLHYYEREGLITSPRRAENGYRVYDPALVDRVRFIRKAQSLGLTLEDVKEIMDLADRGACPCGHVHAALTSRLKEVDERLKELRSFRSDLSSLVRRASAVSSTRSSNGKGERGGAVCEIVEGEGTTESARAQLPLTLKRRRAGAGRRTR